MKTKALQSLFKIALLLTCMAIGFGCDDSDEWETEGMDVTCQLVKIVENGTEVEIPEKILNGPMFCILSLNPDKTFKGSTPANEMSGEYMFNSSSGKIHINILFTTEILNILYDDFEKMYMGYLRKVTSYKQEGEHLNFHFGEDSYLQYKST